MSVYNGGGELRSMATVDCGTEKVFALPEA
jgi:hypothetical protein